MSSFLSLEELKPENIGAAIEKVLWCKNVTSPTTPRKKANGEHIHTDEQAIDVIKKNFDEILSVLGIEVNTESMRNTSIRVANMLVNELFWGLDYTKFPDVMIIPNIYNPSTESMIIERDIKVQSMCEHHLVEISGFANIAYIPNSRLIGLSKLNRIVDFFSRRPQIQERLVKQIFWSLSAILETESIGVVINAEHRCVQARGAKDHASNSRMTMFGGEFKGSHVLQQMILSDE